MSRLLRGHLSPPRLEAPGFSALPIRSGESRQGFAPIWSLLT